MEYLFRRALVGDKITAWHNLVAKIASYQLYHGRDNFTWDLHRHDNFSDTLFINKFIWKLKIPLKIKIFFLCYIQRVTLEVVALDIFAKNGWRNNNRLCF
uniref:Uncharacterized protein n=1 Tax=Setaria viridis TaxID=4556 RepID=A0A4U6TP50_SETVI|nr:hypothetical protein SEVIR_7G001100v2 [Setaria viridis]